MNDAPAMDLRDSLAGRFRRSLAFAVGIDDYAHVPKLRTAAGDASAVARVLAAAHGFESRTLLNPSGASLRGLLTGLIPEAVGAGDRVLFYYAGHGIALDNDDGPAGYLVPADADPEDPASLLAMAEVQGALAALPCRHLLVVLDCCFAGAFQWRAGNRALGSIRPRRLFRERFDFFVTDPARQVITSAAHDQTALDVLAGPFADARGEVSADDGAVHSPFALALLTGLRGAADLAGPGGADGVITATELYLHLRGEVEIGSVAAGPGRRQTPGFFPLPGHDKGEFVFLVPGARPDLQAAPVQSPYRGLLAFEEADSLLFFGRERVVGALWARAGAEEAANRLIVVIGASGTGKSSVVKAGLIPRLRAAGLDVPPILRPGENPPEALAAALAGRAGGRFVLVVDQYEELVTRCRTPEDRAAFEAGLAALLADPLLHRVILTVRSDFEPLLLDGPLRAAWGEGRFVVPAFTLDELHQAVLAPAAQAALVFQPDSLVDEIVEEVAQAPGALPLLSFALDALYERYRASGRDDRILRAADWRGIGGVRGALRQTADLLHDGLDEDARLTMRRVMLRMVSLQADLASQRALRTDLDFPDDPPERVSAVLDRLAEARLIVRDEGWVEPAHDALVRGWERLRAWVAEAREDILLAARLGPAAAKFAATGDAGFLWNADPDLPSARALAARRDHWLNRGEARFIAASERRRRRGARLRIGAVAVFVVGVTAFGGWALVERNQALRQRDHAQAQSFGMQARRVIAERQTLGDAEFAGPNALTSMAIARKLGEQPPPDAIEAALQALHLMPVARLPGGGMLAGLKGGLLATIDPGKTITISDPDHAGTPPVTWSDTTEIVALAALPDGRLATGDAQGRVVLWTATGERQDLPRGDPVQALAPLHDGGLAIAEQGEAGRVRLWPSGRNLIAGGRVSALAVLDDGRIAIGRGDTVLFWNGTSPPSRRKLEDGVSSIAALPDGKVLVANAAGDALYVLDGSDSTPPWPVPGDLKGIAALVRLPDGQVAVQMSSGATGPTLLLWDPAAPATTSLLTATPGLNAVAPLSDGRIAVSTLDPYRNETLIFPPSSEREPVRVPGVDAAKYETIREAPDGTAVIYGLDGRITIRRGDTTKVIEIGMDILEAVPLAGGRVAVAGQDQQGGIAIFSASDRSPPVHAAHGAALAGLVALPDGRLASASKGPDGTVKLWKPDLQGPPETRTTGLALTILLAFPDGRIAALGEKQGVVWDAAGTARPLGFGGIGRAAALPDGKIVTVENDDTSHEGLLVIHDLSGTDRIPIWAGPPVGVLAVLPDGRLATAGKQEDGRAAIRIWPKGLLGSEPVQLSPEAAVYDLAVLADGRVAAMMQDPPPAVFNSDFGVPLPRSAARAWLVDEDAIIAAVCARPGEALHNTLKSSQKFIGVPFCNESARSP